MIGSTCILLHVCVRVCMCVRVAPGCLHVVVILGLMKEFSASPLSLSPRPGLGWGEGEKDEGGNGKGTKRMMVGEGKGKERGFSRIKAFLCGF